MAVKSRFEPLALLVARTFQDADDSALTDWKWERGAILHHEFVRPDTLQRVRFAVDMPHVLQGLRWGTVVYLGRNWAKRTDFATIRHLIETEFFIEGDPQLPPPRPPRSNRLERTAGEMRDLLQQMERRR